MLSRQVGEERLKRNLQSERPVNSAEEEIVQVLSKELGRGVRAADSLDSLGIDSLRMAQLATELESRFDFLADEELLDVESVKELAEYVQSRSSASRR